MYSGVERHVTERISTAPVLADPFPHCVVDGIFPPEFYEEIQDHWPEDSSFVSLGETGRVSRGSYEQRRVVLFTVSDFARLDADTAQFWRNGIWTWLMGASFCGSMVEKFRAALAPRLHAGLTTKGDALIVSDRTDYAIGPHTDAPARLVSLLFYLPEDATFPALGTSLYRPRDPAFGCPGGPHHGFDRFYETRTVEFIPNRLLLFPKTLQSFHGVKRVTVPSVERRLLIFNVRETREGAGSAQIT